MQILYMRAYLLLNEVYASLTALMVPFVPISDMVYANYTALIYSLICFLGLILFYFSTNPLVVNVVKLLHLLFFVKWHSSNKSGKYFSFADIFEAQVDRYPNRVQMINADTHSSTTLKEMDQLSNQVAHWGMSVGLHVDNNQDCVALMMYNCSEYVSIWLGFAKIGVTTALINTNTIGRALYHSVDAATTSNKGDKYLIVEREIYMNVIKEEGHNAFTQKGINVIIWEDIYSPPGEDSIPSTSAITRQSTARPPHAVRAHIKERDCLLYIYTSGTTGLPKASKISHSRYYIASAPFRIMCSLNPTDRVYCPLPLYHSAGGMLGVGACITSGSCLVVRKKFSVRSFSSDCAQFGCNKMQYIGELCRYLAHAPYNSDDQDVKLEVAFGNGLRPDVWTKFKDRYNIKQVVEFYASTEGNLATFNTAGKVGALGFVPRFFNFVYPVKIVKPSLEDSSIPLRGNDGKCVPADVDESGLVLGEINDNRSDRRFDGYTDTTATESKILVNVFQEGDKYFNTGDLLSQDQLGFFYWGDRVGDTFRWKGENVSTSEVEVVIDFITDIEDCCCYGVIVPGYDGRAGCVAVTLNQDTDIDHFSWDEFKLVCSSNLQPLSRPVFVKFVDSIPVTSTFKHKKTDLLAQGIAITDDSSLFVWSAKEKEYIPFDGKVLQDLQDGNFRL